MRSKTHPNVTAYINKFQSEKSHRRFWTPEETALLWELMEGGVNNGQWVAANVPELKGRTASSIENHMSRLARRRRGR